MGFFKEPEFEVVGIKAVQDGKFIGVKVVQDRESAAVMQVYTPEKIEPLKSQFESTHQGLIEDLRLNPNGEIEIDFREELNLAHFSEAIRKIKAIMG